MDEYNLIKKDPVIRAVIIEQYRGINIQNSLVRLIELFCKNCRQMPISDLLLFFAALLDNTKDQDLIRDIRNMIGQYLPYYTSIIDQIYSKHKQEVELKNLLNQRITENIPKLADNQHQKLIIVFYEICYRFFEGQEFNYRNPNRIYFLNFIFILMEQNKDFWQKVRKSLIGPHKMFTLNVRFDESTQCRAVIITGSLGLSDKREWHQDILRINKSTLDEFIKIHYEYDRVFGNLIRSSYPK